ncbi:gamma-glutamyltransferase [Hyphomonas neptunium ATCC 15444]|uniref:Gamma-glutamyltransferase n=2 Tax=Hyphomonas TaxID=85 RepID=Q0BYH3_HYPNA|nr:MULTISPECIES: gamma-glutamyltransferase family protein [Hyphomonas]ABI76535.1 gamma-glutamyltransferase [Hyphomonas neptunium ATCC 15444]KCZ87058.1 gamma-glutamyltransferase [Hyphomonas hirschiana VP5]
MKYALLTGAACALALAACAQTPEPAPQALEPAPVTAAPETTPAARENAAFPMTGQRPESGRPIATRSAVVAPNGAAATAHPLATQTALDVLKAGGTAVDAAIAANAMLGLVEPTGNGIGGDLYAIVWDPETEQLYGYNGSGRSAMDATLEDAQAKADQFKDGKSLPSYGAITVTVPGTVDGWFALHEKFGQRPMADNLAPAVKYAREGAPIPEMIAWYWSRGPLRFEPAFERGELEEFANAKKTYFDPTPVAGSLFKNPDLANTLETIGKKGRDEFYKGVMAKDMAAYFSRIGGKLDYDDFNAHTGDWVEPICVEYRSEVKVCELGPNTQGVAALQMLEMLERFDLKSMGFGSPDAVTAMVEAKRLAFADRALGYADPAFSGIDPSIFVAPGYNAKRAEAIDVTRAMPEVAPGTEITDAALRDGDTTYLTVTDKDGMMVSLIQSNYRGMGSGLVADGMGFMFQDRGELFSLDANHPNVFAPGKRPFHTIIPAFAFRKDLPGCQTAATAPDLACPYEPWLSFGLMGGATQPQGHVQIITNLIDFDMGLQEAGDAARWEHDGGCEPTNALGDDCDTGTGTVMLERGLAGIADELESRGYDVACCEANYGGYQAIMRDFRSGAWIAATEMRKDGNADGY